jgi:hypothetical protein
MQIQGLMIKIGKILQLEKVIFILIKNLNLVFLCLRRTSKLQEKPSALKREHPALQNMKFLDFFLIIFALLDPDPTNQNLFVENMQQDFRSTKCSVRTGS